MKKIAKLFAVAFAFVAAASCQDRLAVIDGIQGETELVTCTFEASMPETKATLSGLEVLWQEGDKIAVYDNKNVRTEFTLISGAGTKNGVFQGEIAAGYTGFYVVYPASAGGVKGAITVPVEQNIATGTTVDPAALIMRYGANGAFGKKVQTFKMENVCGVARMTVPAGTKTATFSGSGACYTAKFAVAPAEASSVDVVLPMAEYEDILVAVTTDEGSFVKSTVNPFNIHSGEVLKLGDVKGDPAVLIKSGAELKSFLEGWPKPNAYVVNNLDLTGVELPDTATIAGVFDGRGLSIKNGTLKAPLFKTNNGTVKNVVVDKSCTVSSSSSYFATLVYTNNGTVENCTNNAAVSYEAETADPVMLGGLVLINKGPMKNCVNAGKITLTTKGEIIPASPCVGGVAAYTSGKMTNVTNTGAIDVDVYGSASSSKSAMPDHPLVVATGGKTIMPVAGGVAAMSFFGSSSDGFDKCVNKGVVSWTYTCGVVPSYVFVRTYVAGVCGSVYGGYINDCCNYGSVENIFNAETAVSSAAKQLWAGGVYTVNNQEFKGSFPTASRCVNYGTVKLHTDYTGAYNYAGGVCAAPDGETTDAKGNEVYGCINYGDVNADGFGKVRVGGVSAVAGKFNKCINNGNVTGGENLFATSQIGGLVGFQNGKNDVHVVSDCENYGTIKCPGKNEVYVGGIFGATGGTTAGSSYYGCISDCKAEGTAACKVGIFVGNLADKAYNFGTADKPNKAAGTVVRGEVEAQVDASNLDEYAFGSVKVSALASVTANVAAYVAPTTIEYAGETYKIVRLKDGKWWMAENLRYVPEGYTPSNDTKNVTAGVYYPVVNNAGTAVFSTGADVVKARGYLYQSEVALGLKVGDIKTAAQAASLEGCRGICPEGWHIPTIEDITKLVGRAVAPAETYANAPYYNGSNGSMALLNADGFAMDAFGAVTILDNTKTSATLLGALKGYTDRTTSGYFVGSSFAAVTYTKSGDDRTAPTNFAFFGLMPMTNKASAADYTCNGSKLSYRIGAAVRCVKDNN